MVITKTCKSLRSAESFQTRLYGKYDSVKLVRFPTLSEAGVYAWEVE